MASLAVALVLLTGVLWRSFLPMRFGADEPGRTIVLAPQRQELPDGTIVELREGTILSHDFSGELRRVTLARGEAHFQVAKNPARPFVVTAAGVNVRAVGTAFTVQVNVSAVEVLVTEGRVAVAEKPALQVVAADSRTSPGTLVDAGHLAVVSGTGVSGQTSSGGTIVTPLAADAIEDRLGWRVARIEFSATALAEAIALLNRNSAVQLTLADPTLASLRISGIVRADNTEALVRLLVANYEVVAEPVEGRGVVLKRR
ncbi:MAG: FecR domain-containing protein [Opitutaceae bacterium]|nr:FecR domain-containing protein [Opitutaceae bacterium]